ncbi:MAG: hypothetical protein ACI8UO_004929 [Verrucomicrobiales bacterium]
MSLRSNLENAPRYAVVIPVCDEEECIGAVLDELATNLPLNREITVAVGLNDISDRSGEIARDRPGVVVGETDVRGYGDGCQAAIEAVIAAGIEVDAWIFYAGDGASDPDDLPALIAAFEDGAEFVHGTRTMTLRNWRRPMRRIAANLVLGAWTSLLCGELFLDLGPYRVIGRGLYERMGQREFNWGWTIESQILAARLGAKIAHVPVDERRRIAGEQKVSGVSMRQTLKIGWEIARVGLRVACRRLTNPPL